MIDKRTKEYRHLHRWFNKYTRAAAVAGLIVGALGMLIYLDAKLKQPLPELLSPLSEVKGMEVTPTPTINESYYKEEPLRYIRYAGQKLGYSDREISQFIKVARCESGFNLNANAKNPDSTATGIFQIVIGTWDGNRCTGERWDFVDNIDCAYKIYAKRGLQPWNASKHCWNK